MKLKPTLAVCLVAMMAALSINVAMFSVLVFICIHLARREERDSVAEFGDEYRRYMVTTPAFIPAFGGSRSVAR